MFENSSSRELSFVEVGESIGQDKPPSCIYFIYILPRSGSTYLTSLLQSSYNLGFPNEWLNWTISYVRERIQVRKFINPDHYFKYLLLRYQTENGVFGCQAAAPHFFDFKDSVDINGYVSNPIQHFYLKRKNLVAQAVSLFIANESGVYHSIQLEQGRPDNRLKVIYNRNRIKSFLETILHQESRFESYFATEGISPKKLTYEDFTSNKEKTVELFARTLGVECKFRPDADKTIKKISTHLNREFENKFRLDMAEYLKDVEERRSEFAPSSIT